jgi:Amt family ammonium transporter
MGKKIAFTSGFRTRAVIDAAKAALYTGHIGDGKIFVYNIENVVKIRTNEEGYDALQDD